MTKSITAAGYFSRGVPYNRFGHGSRDLILFEGLGFENKPKSGLMGQALTSGYRFLEEEYTLYLVTRKPGLPDGYTLQDMSDDYAEMIREEFGKPVDVIGVSTGGSIAQYFAADHPDLVRKLIIHSSAYKLSDEAKDLQMHLGHLALRRKWRAAYAALFHFVLPHSGGMQYLTLPVAWLGAVLAAAPGVPRDPSDFVVTVKAEDRHNFKDRLGQIQVPTLVAGGDKDPFYTAALFRETAGGIPNARLVLYHDVGHPASGKLFNQDVLQFLKEDPG